MDTAALAAAVAGGDAWGSGGCVPGCRPCWSSLRRYDEALAHLGIALQIATAEGNDGAVASVHTMMRTAYGYADRFEECRHHALRRVRRAPPGRRRRRGGGLAAQRRDRPAPARPGGSTPSSPLSARARAGPRSRFAREQELADVLGRLADAYLGAGRMADAEVAATEAVAVARDREHPMAEAQALAVLGRSLRDRDRRTATGRLRRAMDVYRELDQPRGRQARGRARPPGRRSAAGGSAAGVCASRAVPRLW